MTTIDTAAAWRVVKPFTLVAMAIISSLGLAGCETGSNVFGATNTGTPALTQQAQSGQPSGRAKVTIAPVIGAPDAVAKQLAAQLSSEIERKNVTVARVPGTPSDYTVRGYIVSAKESVGTKISYIWDLTDTQGKRVTRITGEELLANASGTDPWAAVTPDVVGKIAGKTASSIATWLPSQQTTSAMLAPGSPTIPRATSPSLPTPVVAATPAAGVALTPRPTPIATNTTGSITQPGKLLAMVPSVTGAPGDGGVSLTGALQRELARKGVALSNAPSGQTYTVAGNVIVGQGKQGKQPIQIAWNVKDPTGKKLGTVLQKNEIPQGSLDGAWGQTADAAAVAAAQGILKLLPQPN